MTVLRISVGSKDINAAEWIYDEECKYCESFTNWAELLKTLSQYMKDYAYIYIVDDTKVC